MYDLIFNYVKTVYSILVYIVFYGHMAPWKTSNLTEPVAYICNLNLKYLKLTKMDRKLFIIIYNMFTMHGVSKTWLVYPTGPCIQLGVTARWEFLNDQCGIDLFY